VVGYDFHSGEWVTTGETHNVEQAILNLPPGISTHGSTLVHHGDEQAGFGSEGSPLQREFELGDG
jgi:hypothetical protein